MALIFIAYAYQDVWPLATYPQPIDLMNIFVLSKIALLLVGGGILPLVTPYLKMFESDDQKSQGLGTDIVDIRRN